LAKKALQDATDKQSKLKTALEDANSSYLHWEADLKIEEAKSLTADDTNLIAFKKEVTKLEDDYTTKNTDYVAK